MSVKLIFVIFTLVSAVMTELLFARKSINPYHRQRIYNVYSAMICILMFIVVAFRPFDISQDTTEYVSDFIMGDFNQVNDYDNPGFAYLMVFISRVFQGSPEWLLVITSLFFPIAFYDFMKQIKTDCIGLAVVVLLTIALGFFDFILSGMKQTIAISIVLFSYRYLRSNSFWKFLFTIIFASLFHSTALVAIIIYPLRRMKFGIVQLCILAAMFAVYKFVPTTIFALIEESFLAEQYMQYADYESDINNSMLLILIALIAAVVCFWKRLKSDEQNVVWMNISIWAVGFQMFSGVIGEFFRIALYFSLPLVALTTKMLDNTPWQIRKLGRVLFVAIILYYVLSMQDGYFTNYKLMM